MSLFGMFESKDSSEEKKEKEENTVAWNVLTGLDQLDTITEESKTLPVAIFKHSTRCGISKMALRQFENSFDLEPNQMKLYYLDLLNNRDISDEVGHKFQVMHQSPQLIVIKNGHAVAHASHHSINTSELEKFI